MDRRYRMELQLVRVPVVWRAKVPEKKLFPVTRKVPEQRAKARRKSAAARLFIAAMIHHVPEWLLTQKMWDMTVENPYDPPMLFKRFMPPGPADSMGGNRPDVPPWEDE